MNQFAFTISQTLQTLTDVSHHQDNGVADGPKPDEIAQQNPDYLTGNTKLWLGKDYNNFITKDWVQLEKPFEGTLSKSPSVSDTHAHTHADALKVSEKGAERICFYNFQITLTALKFLACRGVICLQLFMAELPGI